MAQSSFEHQIAYITTKIDVEPPNAPKSIGTGFFYHAPLNDGTDNAITLLISNKHVFGNPTGRLKVSLNRRKEDNTPDLGNIRTINQVGFEGEYFAHPAPAVDLACVNFTKFIDTDTCFHCLSDDFLTPINYEKIAIGSDVIFVGYPEGFYDNVNNLPLLRRGVIASVPNVDFKGKGQIVIDAQIFPGSSGSPVFAHWDNKYSLLGVISDTVLIDSELQILPTNMSRVGVQQVLGLGIVIKQEHVRKLIDYAVQEFIRRTSPSS